MHSRDFMYLDIDPFRILTPKPICRFNDKVYNVLVNRSNHERTWFRLLIQFSVLYLNYDIAHAFTRVVSFIDHPVFRCRTLKQERDRYLKTFLNP